VLKVGGEGSMPFMEFGNSDDVKLGSGYWHWVPLNLDATVTAGIVSAKGRSLGVNKQRLTPLSNLSYRPTLRESRQSGGALVNTAASLIGINSAIASPTGSYGVIAMPFPQTSFAKL